MGCSTGAIILSFTKLSDSFLKNEYQSCFARLVDFDNAILRCPENGDVAIVGVICNCRAIFSKYYRNFSNFEYKSIS